MSTKLLLAGGLVVLAFGAYLYGTFFTKKQHRPLSAARPTRQKPRKRPLGTEAVNTEVIDEVVRENDRIERLNHAISHGSRNIWRKKL